MEMELFRRIKESYFGKYSIFDIAYPLSMSQNAKKSHTRWRLQQQQGLEKKLVISYIIYIKKKQKLSDVADWLNVSEVMVRKKLESESTNFFSILLDMRMNPTFKLLVYEYLQVNIIVDNLGFSSVPYFMRTFRSYYALMP